MYTLPYLKYPTLSIPYLYPMLINTLPYIHWQNDLVLNIYTIYCNL